MNNTQRRLYLHNWAILTAGSELESINEVKWYFGDMTREKILQTLDFVNAITELGREIWGQGLGTIKLRYPRPHPSQAKELLIINLLDRYSIVISDPLVTTRLMSTITLDSDPIPPWDDMKSILAGTASVIYSKIYSQEEGILSKDAVDVLFQETVNSVTYNEEVTVGNGKSSFSALDFEELIFLNVLLKEIFETYIPVTQPSAPWGVISSHTSIPIHLEYDSPLDVSLISAFSSVILKYCKLLFTAYPVRLIFGPHTGIEMDFCSTDSNFFVFNNLKKLLKLQQFRKKWKQIPAEVAYDLAPAMKSYLVDLMVQEQQQKLKSLEFHNIIDRLTHMGDQQAKDFQLPPH